MTARKCSHKLPNIATARMGRQGGSLIPTRKSPGSTKSEIAAAQEHTIKNKALAAVEALMGMGPMQERLTHAASLCQH
jgi:hypothetical protein